MSVFYQYYMGDAEDIQIDEASSVEIGSSPPMMLARAPDHDVENLIMQHMDICQPLSTLRRLLQSRLCMDLSDYEFYLQDVIPLDPAKNLVSQCVQGSGMVQINVEIKHPPGVKPRLNIIDILKPAEEADMPKCENVTRWIVDQGFRREQETLGIPSDPADWTEDHIRYWILWAIREFNLLDVDPDKFNINGKTLCDLKHEDFVKLVPTDKGDIFWTHLELLRKCKFVAVIQHPAPNAITTITVSTSDANKMNRPRKRPIGSADDEPHAKQRQITVPHTERILSGNRKGLLRGNNGQIQLWQFLLEILTDKDYLEIIHWVGDNGEFKLNNPEAVASLWGQRKNKNSMNYEKLSRALRYYYDGDMIAKVHGKRFVYKFVCDLRQLLGYSAYELKQQVHECAEKHMINVAEAVQRQHSANPRAVAGSIPIQPVPIKPKCVATSAQCVVTRAECVVTSAQCVDTSVRGVATSAQCVINRAQCIDSSAQCVVTSAQCVVSGTCV